jgi:DNA-binding MarR family transcriptional regulator
MRGVQARLLVLIRHRPWLPLRAYAEGIGISKAHMTTLVDECTRAGWVVREADTRDRRAYRLALSDAGLTEAERIWEHYVAQTARALHDIPEPHREVFLAVCARLTERLHDLGCGSHELGCTKDDHADSDS